MVTDYADYYSDLELTPGASPEEVKRAYFRLVHQYTPEKNPEEFKRIRLAYNALKDGTPQMEETSFPRPEDPLLQLPLQQAFRMAEHKDYEGASSAFAGILDVIPDNPFALMHLAQCQSYAGHPQKSAKTALHLAELYPDSRQAWRIAAQATYSRGWYKKALPMLRKAYALGERQMGFLTDYASAAKDNGEFDESRKICREILQGGKWTRDTVEYATEAYHNLADMPQSPEEALWVLDSYRDFLTGNRRLSLGIEELMDPVAVMFYHNTTYMGDLKVYRAADDCLDLIGKKNRDESHPFLQMLRLHLLGEMIEADKRFHSSDWVTLADVAHLDNDSMIEGIISEADRDYALLDLRLCLLMEEPEQFQQDVALIKSDYPYLYQANREFLEQALSEGQGQLLSRLKKQFLKVYHKYKGSRFRERYPQEVPPLVSYTKVHDGDQPFARKGAKVGRNDPCPCGSGKKFKKCCIGKGIYD